MIKYYKLTNFLGLSYQLAEGSSSECNMDHSTTTDDMVFMLKDRELSSDDLNKLNCILSDREEDRQLISESTRQSLQVDILNSITQWEISFSPNDMESYSSYVSLTRILNCSPRLPTLEEIVSIINSTWYYTVDAISGARKITLEDLSSDNSDFKWILVSWWKLSFRYDFFFSFNDTVEFSLADEYWEDTECSFSDNWELELTSDVSTETSEVNYDMFYDFLSKWWVSNVDRAYQLFSSLNTEEEALYKHATKLLIDKLFEVWEDLQYFYDKIVPLSSKLETNDEYRRSIESIYNIASWQADNIMTWDLFSVFPNSPLIQELRLTVTDKLIELWRMSILVDIIWWIPDNNDKLSRVRVVIGKIKTNRAGMTYCSGIIGSLEEWQERDLIAVDFINFCITEREYSLIGSISVVIDDQEEKNSVLSKALDRMISESSYYFIPSIIEAFSEWIEKVDAIDRVITSILDNPQYIHEAHGILELLPEWERVSRLRKVLDFMSDNWYIAYLENLLKLMPDEWWEKDEAAKRLIDTVIKTWEFTHAWYILRNISDRNTRSVMASKLLVSMRESGKIEDLEGILSAISDQKERKRELDSMLDYSIEIWSVPSIAESLSTYADSNTILEFVSRICDPWHATTVEYYEIKMVVDWLTAPQLQELLASLKTLKVTYNKIRLDGIIEYISSKL